jgi:hypothetical protein
MGCKINDNVFSFNPSGFALPVFSPNPVSENNLVGVGSEFFPVPDYSPRIDPIGWGSNIVNPVVPETVYNPMVQSPTVEIPVFSQPDECSEYQLPERFDSQLI